MTVDLNAAAAVVPDSVVDRVRAARNVLALSHEHPDADTIGATLAICRLVERAGGTATAVCADPVPALYDFLAAAGRFRTDLDPGTPFDLVVVSDCGSFERVGDVARRHGALLEALPRVVIDHHASNEADGGADWVDPDAAATCEMIALLATRLGVPLDLDDGALATELMAGIVMDTATFAHPNVTPRTLAVAGALVEAGAPLSDISRRLYRTKPDRQLKLFGRVLAGLETTADGSVVHATLDEADLAATATDAAHSEGLIDLLSQAEAAEVAILFKEQGPATRISVRTRPGGVDATELTGRFGGGGHARAAGATIDRPVGEARPLVLAEAERLAAAVRR